MNKNIDIIVDYFNKEYNYDITKDYHFFIGFYENTICCNYFKDKLVYTNSEIMTNRFIIYNDIKSINYLHDIIDILVKDEIPFYIDFYAHENTKWCNENDNGHTCWYTKNGLLQYHHFNTNIKRVKNHNELLSKHSDIRYVYNKIKLMSTL